MSHRTFVLFFIAFAAACASRPSNRANITEPEIAVAQEQGPADLGWPVGQIELKYTFQIENRWSQPMTVNHIDVQSLNPAGAAYALRRDSYSLHETIAPGEARVVTIYPKAYSYGRSGREGEPISLRAVVHFDTPAGTYQTVISRELPQN